MPAMPILLAHKRTRAAGRPRRLPRQLQADPRRHRQCTRRACHSAAARKQAAVTVALGHATKIWAAPADLSRRAGQSVRAGTGGIAILIGARARWSQSRLARPPDPLDTSLPD